MIEINRQEVEYFKKLGYGFPEPLHKTKTKYCKYYLTENPKYLKILDDLRKSRLKGEM